MSLTVAALNFDIGADTADFDESYRETLRKGHKLDDMRATVKVAARGVAQSVDDLTRVRDKAQAVDRLDPTMTVHTKGVHSLMRRARGIGGAVSRMAVALGKFAMKTLNTVVNMGRGMAHAAESAGKMATNIASSGARGLIAVGVLGALATAAAAAAEAMVGVATAAASVAGAVAGAFAGIGIGAMLFAQTRRGKRALQRFKASALAILTGAARPLLNSFAAVLPQVTQMLRGLQPVFHQVFTVLAGVVRRGAHRAISAINLLGPAIGGIVQAGSRFIDAFTGMFGVIAHNLRPALVHLRPALAAVSSILGRQMGRALATILPDLLRLAHQALPLLPPLFSALAGVIHGVVIGAQILMGIVGHMVVGFGRLRTAVARARLAFDRFLDMLPLVNRQQAIAADRARVLAAKQSTAGVKAYFFGNKVGGAKRQLQGMNAKLGPAARKTHALGVRQGTGKGAAARYAGQLGNVNTMLWKQKGLLRDVLVKQANLTDLRRKSRKAGLRYKGTLNQINDKLDSGSFSLNKNTTEGVANRRMLLRLVGAGDKQIKTLIKEGASVKEVNAKAHEHKQQLKRVMRQSGMTQQQIHRYIKELWKTPQQIATDIDAKTKEAKANVRGYKRAANQALESIRDQGVNIDIGYNTNGVPHGLAAGGPVSGSGGPTSDAIPARLSAGEYVVNARSAAMYKPLLDAVNARRFAAGGPVMRRNENVTTTYHTDTPERSLMSIMTSNITDWARSAMSSILSTFGGGAPSSVSGVQAMVKSMAARLYGWVGRQWSALYQLVSHESSWNPSASNPISSAHGLFQFLDSTRAAYGIPWTNNPKVQAGAGLRYLADRYGTPANAWSAWLSRSPHWYDHGGIVPPGTHLIHNGTGQGEVMLNQRQLARLVSGRSGGEFVGALYLDSGAFVGQVKGVLSEHDRDQANAARAGLR